MLKVTVTVVLLSFVMLLVGCQSLTRDSEQNIHKYSRISDYNRRMLTDDIDALLLLDQPSRLTPMNINP